MRTKNEIVAELFQSREFNDCINKMDPEHLRDDLRSEVALILLETEEQKLMAIDRKGELRFYTVRIILNLIQSKTSPFYKKYRRFMLQIAENNKALGILDYNDNEISKEAGRKLQQHYYKTHTQGYDELNGRYYKELMEEQAIEHIEKLYWYDKEIVQLYLRLGSYRAIEKDTGIPWESCYSTIRKVIKQIRNELKPV